MSTLSYPRPPAKNTWRWSIILILHAVGIIGIAVPSLRELVLPATPLHLLVINVLLLWAHPGWTSRTAFAIGLCFAGGMAVEIIGVQTGLIFGDYHYGPVLGPQVGGVPWIIGLNWVMLLYLSGWAAARLMRPGWRRSWWAVPLAAALMAAMDVLIEPVAIQLGFWHWAGGSVPLVNYLAWFVTAGILHGVLRAFDVRFRSPVAMPLLLAQIIFFGVLALVL